ncbi:MAG: DUF3667 domain-containing protein [Betaproteobacteria bacterium]
MTSAQGATHGLPCRNCGALAPGRYCAECGQETQVSLPTARQFMREATGRLVDWDGRLWRTLFALAFRPGALTLAYLAGRRRFYVRPARLFLAMSLILFAVIRLEIGTADTGSLLIVDSGDKTASAGTKAEEGETARAPPAVVRKYAGIDWFTLTIDDELNLGVRGTDSVVLRGLRARFDRFNRFSTSEKSERLVDGALRYGSYLLFLLLPVFAALQYVAYAGRGGRYPGRPRLYAEHLVYGAHLHTFAFLALIVAIVVPVPAVRWVLFACVIVYVARARRNVYGGSALGGAGRAALVGAVYLVALLAGVVGLMMASIVLR